MNKRTHKIIMFVLYIVFGQVLVFGGISPTEKPFYFFGMIALLCAIDILSYYGALKHDRW